MVDRPLIETPYKLGDRMSYTQSISGHARGLAETVTIVGRSFRKPFLYDITFPDGSIKWSVPGVELGAAPVAYLRMKR